MQTLRITLLGTPQIILGETPLPAFSSRKAQALLFYLATTVRTHTRDELASLFWSDMPDAQARKNLRNILPVLRMALGSHIYVTRGTVTLNRCMPYWCDVELFRTALDTGSRRSETALDLQTATALYTGDFLDGFYVREAPIFEEWMLTQREHLRELAINGLQRLADQQIEHGEYQAGLTTTRRLLVLEPWRETAHRQHMLLLACSGQRDAALAQYELCRRSLIREFGVEPVPETTTLYTQIKTGQLPGGESVARPAAIQVYIPSEPDPPLQPAHFAPYMECDQFELPPLYGRQAELDYLRSRLTASNCRMVTVYGMVGQGKTVLVRHVVKSLCNAFHGNGYAGEGVPATEKFNRVLWYALPRAYPFTEVMPGWLPPLDEPPPPLCTGAPDDWVAHLLDCLREQRCLVVLDNVESLMCEGDTAGQFHPDHQAYERLIEWMAHGEYQGCLLLVSREQPRQVQYLEANTPGVWSRCLAGLSVETGQLLLEAYKLQGSPAARAALVKHYAGNPLALRLAAQTIQGLFGHNIDDFLAENVLIFDTIRDVPEQACGRLTPLEYEITGLLASTAGAVSFRTLWCSLAHQTSKVAALEALHSLQRRALIDYGPDGFRLNNLVLEYTRERLRASRSAQIIRVTDIAAYEAGFA